MTGLTADPGGLIEAVAGGETGAPGRFAVRIIRAGRSKNGTHYSDAVLRESSPLFEGVRVLAKSDADHLASRGRDVRALVGQISGVVFREGDRIDRGELVGVLSVIDPADPLALRLREAVGRGMAGLFGLSIDAVGAVGADGSGRRVTRIDKVNSVDLVLEPAAGGGITGLVEAAADRDTDMALRDTLIEAVRSARPALLEGRDVATLDEAGITALLTEALAAGPAAAASPAATPAPPAPAAPTHTALLEAAGALVARQWMLRDRVTRSALPERAKAKLIAELSCQQALTEAVVDRRIGDEIAYLAPETPGGVVASLGGQRIQITEGRHDKAERMLEAFFDPAHADHGSAQSFRDIYRALTGDQSVTGRRRDCDKALLREALGTADFPDALGDALTRRMIAEYRAYTDYEIWRRAATVVPVGDFRTQERISWGGFGDLPVVAQGAPYVDLTAPADRDPTTYAVGKRGGLWSITIEMVKNDDVGLIRSLPTRAARAAKRTLAKHVLEPFTTNPAIYDAKALFHADHANLGTAALTAASWAACRLAMVKQIDTAGDQIGVGPSTLWLAPDGEEAAYNLFQRSTNQDRTFIQTLVPTIIPVPFWTDANDWVATADPADIPVYEVGFLDNKQEPEFWTQDQPTSGSLFSNDKITYKIRHIYGRGVLDYRGAYKAVVA